MLHTHHIKTPLLLESGNPQQVTLFPAHPEQHAVYLTPTLTSEPTVENMTRRVELHRAVGSASSRHVAHLKHERDEALELAGTDVLTDLPNRRKFLDVLEAHIAGEIETESGHSQLNIMLMDLDKFKLVNDTLGHDEGDRLLKAIGTFLKHHKFRKGDGVYRIGGDEFAFIISSIPKADQVGDKFHRETDTEEANIQSLSEYIKKEIKAIAKQLDIEIEDFGASFGFVKYQKGESIKELMKRVDVKLYEDKNTPNPLSA
jgi:diguanylate cyclase (GGDEF)-like protein